MRFVLDTNVMVAALRSSEGASYAILSALPIPTWELALSVPLYLEYQDVLSRPDLVSSELSGSDVMEICRFLASIAHPQDIHFLWPSFLADPKDDMLLELAVAAGATHIVTHNARHFKNVASFGIQVLAPSDFLRLINDRK